MARRFSGRYFLAIDEVNKAEFAQRLRIENIKVIAVISWVGFAFLFLLLYLDFLRYRSGLLEEDPVYQLLFINHLLLVLYLIPIWIINRRRNAIRSGKYRRPSRLIYFWIVLTAFIMLLMATLSLWDRGSVILYAVFVFVLNFVLILAHIDRIIFNVLSLLLITAAIIVMYNNNQVLLIINIFEALGVTIPAFIVSTYRYNNYVKQISSEKLLEAKNDTISQEKLRAEELLLNILPSTVAEELKEHGKVAPKHFDSISILFADVVGFTVITKVLTAQQLVSDLHYCFSSFDKITKKYGLEKIKTMGDAYICVAGFEGSTDYALRIVRAAKEMLEFTERWNKEKLERSEPPYRIRIGIHTGPVVAGVVGLNKFAFDIWGDAVNIAARLEENSEVGKVNVSKSTYLQIKDYFHCASRGRIAIKNAGEIEMYFVEEAKDLINP